MSSLILLVVVAGAFYKALSMRHAGPIDTSENSQQDPAFEKALLSKTDDMKILLNPTLSASERTSFEAQRDTYVKEQASEHTDSSELKASREMMSGTRPMSAVLKSDAPEAPETSRIMPDMPPIRKTVFDTRAPIRGGGRTSAPPHQGMMFAGGMGGYFGSGGRVSAAVMPRMGTSQSQSGWRSTLPRGRSASTNAGSIFVRT